MKRTMMRYTILAVASLTALNIQAGENLETPTNGFSVISHTLWHDVAMPLEWHLHEDGVINNDANMQGTPAIANPDAVTEISDAFTEWQNVATSNISVVYSGETPTGDSGCDLTNIVTWSDNNVTWPAGVIAMGLTTTYVGPSIVLNNMNRNVSCGQAGGGSNIVNLSAAVYPNGTTLAEGTILDMDMTWNPDEFDYSTTPNAVSNVFDIQAVATHEFGHLFGLSHTSMAFAGVDPATMFPSVSDTNIAFQNNMRSLAQDDIASSGRGYPATGFWPDGVAPYTTGAISGWVRQSNGSAAQGVRVWAYNTADTSQPVYEGFSVTQFDWDPALSAGDYVLKGVEPGSYYVCILPWNNGVPNTQADDDNRYNLTVLNGVGHTGFPTECYDDVASGTNNPDFADSDRIREVEVSAGETTPSINFVTGSGDTDIMLVMDRSGSMNLAADAAFSMSKLDALKLSADSFINFLDLDGGHRLGLVQFNSGVVPFVPAFDLQDLTAASKPDAQNAISGMVAGGMTNIIDGVQEAVNQLTSAASPNDRQVVFVFSDGKHNSPWGSDLMDINGPIVDNDLTLYSLGFGTDVSGVELNQVALNSGGQHVEHQALTPAELQKYFISIAASAVDLTMLVDPLYELTAGKSGSLEAIVSESEKDLIFTMNWDVPNKNQFNTTVISPSGCTIGTVFNMPGVQVRKGDTHRHIKIPMPYRCNNREDHVGTWKLQFTAAKSNHESNRLIAQAFSTSNTKMFTDFRAEKEQPIAETRLVHEGVVVKKADFIADVVIPVKSTGDSDDQDKQDGGKPRQLPPESERTVRIKFTDDGRNGDRKARDGIFTAQLPTKIEGSYRMRIQGQFESGKSFGQREQVSSYYFDGNQISLPKTK